MLIIASCSIVKNMVWPIILYSIDVRFPGYTYDNQRKCYFRIPPKEHSQKATANKSKFVNVTCFPIYKYIEERRIMAGGTIHSLRYCCDDASLMHVIVIIIRLQVLSTVKKRCALTFGDIGSYINIMVIFMIALTLLHGNMQYCNFALLVLCWVHAPISMCST